MPKRSWSEVVQALLKDSGLSGLELAKLAGIDKNAISRISTGRTPKPTYKTLRKIGLALGKTLEQLEALRWEGETPTRARTESQYTQMGKVATVAASEHTERERGRSEGEAAMLRRLGAHGYATAAKLAAFIEEHPGDARSVCRAVEDLLDALEKKGVHTRPKAKTPVRGRR